MSHSTTSPKMKSKPNKPPRSSSSYRAARRNKVLRKDHAIWRGAPSQYSPYRVYGSKPYPYDNERQRERYGRQHKSALTVHVEPTNANPS